MSKLTCTVCFAALPAHVVDLGCLDSTKPVCPAGCAPDVLAPCLGGTDDRTGYEPCLGGKRRVRRASLTLSVSVRRFQRWDDNSTGYAYEAAGAAGYCGTARYVAPLRTSPEVEVGEFHCAHCLGLFDAAFMHEGYCTECAPLVQAELDHYDALAESESSGEDHYYRMQELRADLDAQDAAHHAGEDYVPFRAVDFGSRGWSGTVVAPEDLLF